jgi:hypothetical protein
LAAKVDADQWGSKGARITTAIIPAIMNATGIHFLNPGFLLLFTIHTQPTAKIKT